MIVKLDLYDLRWDPGGMACSGWRRKLSNWRLEPSTGSGASNWAGRVFEAPDLNLLF